MTTATYQQMTLSAVENGIVTLTLNRPDRLNALSEALLNELEIALCHMAKDDAVKGVLLTGAGKAFCAGADITQLAELNAKTGYAFAKRGQQIFRQLEVLGKPSLAAVNGYAFGGGCELAMSATLRIASQSAQFGQPEVKLGIIPGYGGTQRLARLVGKGRALDLCLTGRFIKSEEALQWGLVSEVTSAEQLLGRGKEILGMILKMAPLAVKSTMTVIDNGYDLALPDALELEAAHFSLLCGTRDKQIGVNAFLEKTTPIFEEA